MRILVALLLAVHGAIHVLGFVKAFGLAEVPQLERGITPVAGVLWLAAAVLLVGAAVTLYAAPRVWWAAAAVGIVLSQGLIVAAWSDARFGTVANVLLLVPVVLALAGTLPFAAAARAP